MHARVFTRLLLVVYCALVLRDCGVMVGIWLRDAGQTHARMLRRCGACIF